MKKILLILISMLSLSACNKESTIDIKGFIDEESVKIIEDLKSLASDTFSSKNFFDFKYEIEPKKKSDVKEDIIKNVEEAAKKDKKAQWVYDNYYNLDNVDAYLTGNDPDTIEFIYNKNHNITDFEFYEGESVKLKRQTPYYLQWDNRWAYDQLYPTNIGISGCGPTSLAMIISRLTGNLVYPNEIAKKASSYMNDGGMDWVFIDQITKEYGLKTTDINLDKEKMIEALKEGPLLISVNKGYFTLFGHILVIDSYKDGKFIINDPNSVKNSIIEWDYEDIYDQILKIWSFSK